MTATQTKTEIQSAQEDLAQAAAELVASREDSLRAQRRYQAAFTKWTEAAAKVADLVETRTEGGRKV